MSEKKSPLFCRWFGHKWEAVADCPIEIRYIVKGTLRAAGYDVDTEFCGRCGAYRDEQEQNCEAAK